MPRVLLHWFLGALQLPVQQQLLLVEALTSCKLHFEGFGTAQGLRFAQLSCSGGSIQAAAHPSLLEPFARAFSGVEWSNHSSCADFKKECVFTICGNSSVHFPSAVVRRVNTSKTVSMLICLAGRSNVLFNGAQFQGNTGRSITALSQGVKLHMKGSTFSNNNLLWKDLPGGALLVEGGSAIVESSSFISNSALSSGGAIGVTKNATLKLVGSALKGNTGEATSSAVEGAHDHSYSSLTPSWWRCLLNWTAKACDREQC
jgi:predicted outer membrane repeat protein